MKVDLVPNTGDSPPDLAAKIAFLQQPGALAGASQRVEAIETHLSWVFLTADRVFKLKKPVAHEYVDLTTVEGRRWNCIEELRLNRRFAPEVYLDLIPLTVTPQGAMRLGGDGRVIDWLVVMKRLPQEATLQARLCSGSATAGDIERLAGWLARFYRAATPVPTDPDQYCDRFLARALQESTSLLDPASRLPAGQVEAAIGRLRAFLDTDRHLLCARARDGRIVEAHGDLRPEHVFLMSEPVIIDCLEFSRALRLLDPVDELAYLAMECAHLGHPWVRDVLFAAYWSASADAVLPGLADFYWIARALRRARQAIAHLKDDAVRDPAKWRCQAERYLALASGGGR